MNRILIQALTIAGRRRTQLYLFNNKSILGEVVADLAREQLDNI